MSRAHAPALATDWGQRELALRQELGAVDQLLTDLTVQRGDIALGDDAVNVAELNRVSGRIDQAKERRAALGDALVAVERRKRDESAADARATRLRREIEARELAKALLANDRTADALVKKLGRLVEIHATLSGRLAEYTDVHQWTHEQLDPRHAVNSAFAASGSRMLTERLDLRPVATAGFAQRSAALLDVIETIQAKENNKHVD